MKKLFTLVLAGLLAASLAAAASAEYAVLEEVAPDAVAAGMFGDSYPYSVDYDWPECTSDPILKGTVITGMPASGSHCWSNGTDNASCAFDGDTQTFFDPSEATMESWCGLKLDQAYELSEVRICNRSGQEVRIVGAAIQGSNDDGATWYNVVYFDPAIYGSTALLTNDYHIVTPAKNDAYVEIYQDYMTEEQADFSVYWVGNGSYSMYRYVNLVGTHGDCAEIELYGHPAEAKNGDNKDETVIYTNTVDEFFDEIEDTGVEAAVTDGSIAGTVIGGGGAYSDTAGYACAFDGDDTTFYDPATAGPSCFTGIKTAEPYALTSVKVLPREGWHDRTLGATIQGSNDGQAWTTLTSFAAEDVLAADAERVFITKEITDTNGYTMFRYVSDGQSHGDVAEVCFYGAPAAAAAPAATFGVQEATGSFDGEVADNLFDGDENTKWCFDSASITDPYVIWNVENALNVTGYEIVTANDNADYTGRNPGAWTLSGSADGSEWTVIADVAADTVLQDVNFTPFTFAADNAGEYSWFKYEIGNVVGGGVCQISGLNLLTGEVTPSAAPAEEAPAEEVVEEAPVEEEVVEEAPVEEAPAEEEVVEEEAPQTFDFAIVAAVAAIVSAAGYAVSKKH